MIAPNTFVHYFDYFVKRDVDKFFIAVAIRNLAMGMVLVFEAVYIFLFFNQTIAPVFFFFAALYLLYGLFVVMGAKVISKIGPTRSILVSYFLYFIFYISLFLFSQSFFFVPLAVVAGAAGMALYWPSFHIDFVRFSSTSHRGKEVGKVNVAALLPMVASPFIGGWIITTLGYPALFVAVLITLLASAIPLMYTKETHEMYTDSYRKVFGKIFSRERWRASLAFSSVALEIAINLTIWPLFMFMAAITFSQIGGITSFSLLISALFILYIGKLSDTKDRSWLLNIGAIWTSIAWVMKYFVQTPFDAFLAQTVYKTSRAAVGIPFFTFFYEKAGSLKEQADEFIVYREVINGGAKFIFFALLGVLFLVVPSFPLGVIFFVAAIAVLCFMFLQNSPTMRIK
ncbi:MAG: MFS transporter [Patescibacteria group bacterium]|nr:MFS transporter [Patescibacteria group bacterium]